MIGGFLLTAAKPQSSNQRPPSQEPSFGARPVPGRSGHEDTRESGLIRWLRNNFSRCAPGRRALRSATGPRSQRLRQPARGGTLPKSPIAFGPAARRDVARSGRRRVQGRKARSKLKAFSPGGEAKGEGERQRRLASKARSMDCLRNRHFCATLTTTACA